ncbi:unnamed protein product [Boreogadus saida]
MRCIERIRASRRHGEQDREAARSGRRGESEKMSASPGDVLHSQELRSRGTASSSAASTRRRPTLYSKAIRRRSLVGDGQTSVFCLSEEEVPCGRLTDRRSVFCLSEEEVPCGPSERWSDHQEVLLGGCLGLWRTLPPARRLQDVQEEVMQLPVLWISLGEVGLPVLWISLGEVGLPVLWISLGEVGLPVLWISLGERGAPRVVDLTG